MKIVVPKPPAQAFNKDRPISDLVRNQLKHMYEAEKRLPHHRRTGQSVDTIETEGEASEYIQKITEKLQVPRKIVVPRPPKSAFNKRRPLSDLLKSQVEHFRQIEMTLPADERTGKRFAAIKSEHQAAEYIGTITAKMHARKDAAAGAAVQGPPAAASAQASPAGTNKTTKPKGKGKG